MSTSLFVLAAVAVIVFVIVFVAIARRKTSSAPSREEWRTGMKGPHTGPRQRVGKGRRP